ncbi:MAG: uroporphyrinogen-III synthase [Deltaproteobacteria bacterium]|nr:uroporphyrinogen-III synthase [Deltaproteobacteria bacterium]
MAQKKVHKGKRLPLKGRTILVTQSKNQSYRFTNLLRQKGARVLECPTIEIMGLETRETPQILKRVQDYDWLIFMSQNAVFYFFELFKKYKLAKRHLKGVRVAVIGKTTRESLKQHRVRVHLTPTVYQSEKLANAFKGKLEDKRFLVLSALDGRKVLKEELEKKGAIVDTLSLYKTMVPMENSKELLKMLCEERIDAVTFTSPSTVENFITMLNPYIHRDLKRHIELLTIATLGDVTAKAVEDCGLRVRVRPSEFTIPSFVNTLSREL